MKEKIIYISAFLAAFLIITFGIIYFNSVYRDIFHFDFTEVKIEKPKPVITISDSTKIQMGELKIFLQQQLKDYVLDSIKTYVKRVETDTIYHDVVQDSSLIDSLKNLKLALNKTSSELEKQNKVATLLVDEKKSRPDSLYNDWMKKTAKLYETMDPGKAAKIIQGYSDNIARDIIYTMKQKKAAEILAEFSPENANRIMRAKVE